MSTSQQGAAAPTRQAVLVAWAEQFRLRTGLAHERWSERVDAAYCEHVPARVRRLPAPDLEQVQGAADWQKLLRAWDQTLRRYATDGLRFPVELEEAWVAALEDPWRSECIRELAGRYGLYGAFRRPATVVGDTGIWASVLEDFALVTRDMALVLADGRIDGDDAAQLPTLLSDVERMQADLEGLRGHVLAAAEAVADEKVVLHRPRRGER